MPDLDWNGLQHVLALARTGSYAAAARRLEQDATTVARRIRAIEVELGARLFERGPDGAQRPTQAGEIALARAEAIEAEIGGLTAAVKGIDTAAAGTVRLTAVPVLINHLLLPAAAGLMARHPGLALELIADVRDLSLTRREADIAVRLARPGEEAGDRVITRRIGTLDYAVYAADGADDPPWLIYEGGMAHLPQQRWMSRAAEKGGRIAAVTVNDGDSLLHGVAAGLGKALLPCLIADRMRGLRRLDWGAEPMPGREIWVLTLPDLRHLPRVAAVLDWIEAVLGPQTMAGAASSFSSP